MSFNRNIERGVNQVMYKYAPGATFSHPHHNTIERVLRITAQDNERIGLSNNEEIIQEVYARVQANDGGVIGDLPPSADNYALVSPGRVYSSIFPRLFVCDDCGKLHDYTDHGGWDLDTLADHGGTCLRCDGRLYQIHQVLVCPDCSNMESLTYRSCSNHRGRDEYMVLDDSADRYQDFRWVCRACNGGNTISEGIHRTCSTCDTQMIPTVHSGSQSHRVQSFTRVDLGGHDVYTASLADDEIDLLVLGTLFDMYDREEHSIESLASGSGASLDVDPDNLSAEELELIRNSVDFGDSGPRELVINEVREKVDNPGVSRNLQNYMMMSEALDLEEVATGPGSARAQHLMDRMGIDSLAVTSEFPLLACAYGYKRTFEDQEADDDDGDADDDPEPAMRMFPMIRVDDESRRPIYTKRSETEALIVKLDPRKVGHWLSQLADSRDDFPDRLPDFRGLDRSEARIELYDVLGHVATYEDIEARDPSDDNDPDIDPDDVDPDVPAYTPETVAVHRLIHSIGHLCLQNASMYSGIQENNFAEYLFPEALAFAIYAKQTESYTAGGLYTLVNRRLPEWLRGAYQDGEQCFYDSTCADIWGGACHACLHTGEISCQHFNANLSRIDLYGDRLADVECPGFWTVDWDRALPDSDE